MAGNVNIGTLSGRVELEDKTSATLDLILGKVEKLEQRFGEMGSTVAQSAAGFITAEAAIALANKALEASIGFIKDLTIEGAGIADIQDNFDNLTSSAGRLGETLLNELRAGTHATITDLELMKTINKDLAAGMDLTDEQFRTLAEGAFALAQATGVDVKQAFDTVNDAMLTGRTRSLQMLTGRIDLQAAEEAFAQSLGTTTEKLTEEGKIHAARGAILDAVAKSTQRLGEQTDGLDEMIAQVGVEWDNFYNGLAKTVATSPSVIGAFTSIRDAIVGAFGGDAESAVENVMRWVNGIADGIAQYGPEVITWFVTLKDWVLQVYETVTGTWNTLPDWLKNVATNSGLALAGIVLLDGAVGSANNAIEDGIGLWGNLTTALVGLPTLLGAISGGITQLGVVWKVLDFSSLAQAGASFQLLGQSVVGLIGPMGALAIATAAVFAAWEVGKMESVSDWFFELGLEIQGYTQEEQEAMIATHKTLEAQQKQAEITKQQDEALARAKAMMEQFSASLNTGTVSTNTLTGAQNQQRLVMEQTTEEVRRAIEARKEMAVADAALRNGTTMNVEILKTVKDETEKNIKKYLEAGISLENLAAAYKLTNEQARAIGETWKAEKKQLDEVNAAWKELKGLGHGVEQSLVGVSAVVEDQVRTYLKAGASVDALKKAYNLTDLQLKAIQATLKEGQEAWASESQQLDEQAAKVRTLAGEWISAAEAKERMSQGGSYEVNRSNLAATAKTFGIPESLAFQLAEMGFSFQEIRDAFLSKTWQQWKPQGPRIPGFREGGIGDFGDGTLAMLHGKEAIIPLDKTAGGLGNTTNIFYVNGTAEDVARKISTILMNKAKMGRQFGAA